MPPKISITDFRVHSEHKELLHIPALHIKEATVHAIIGESGSGKSLLLKHLMGFLPQNLHTSGSTQINIQDKIREIPLTAKEQWLSIRGKSIGMVFQEPLSALNPQMTCGKQLWEAWSIHAPKELRKSPEFIKERLQDVGLGDMYERVMQSFPHQLSGGQRQRVVIAMATLHKPEIILADEPTTALDFFSRKKVLSDLVYLVRKLGSTLLWVTHELDVVSSFADEITVLKRGELIQTGSVEQVLQKQPAPYVSELLDALPKKKKVTVPLRNHDLSIYQLHKKYPNGVQALNNFSVDLSSGQTLAVIGTSGSGKSTLAKVLTALESPSSGSVSILGKPLAKYPPTGIQMVFQDPFASLNKRHTCLQAMLEVLQVCFPGEAKERRLTLAQNGLNEVGLDATFWHKKPTEMSGGQRQRLCIAKALASNPKMLILDEAVAALDPLVQRQVLELLQKLQKEKQLIFLFITHDLAVASSIADEMVFLESGCIKPIPPSWLEHMPD